MSAYRNSLQPWQLPIYDQAIAEAGIALAHAEAAIHERYLQGGAEAVAEAAWWPGCGHTKEELAGLYRRLRAEAEARAAAGTAA